MRNWALPQELARVRAMHRMWTGRRCLTLSRQGWQLVLKRIGRSGLLREVSRAESVAREAIWILGRNSLLTLLKRRGRSVSYKLANGKTVLTKPKKTRQGSGKHSKPKGDRKPYRGQGR